MDDDLQTLEAELMRLRPVAPSAGLEARVRNELGNPAAVPHRARWLAVAALPIAAAIAALIALKPRSVLKPVSAENVLYAATEDGVVTLEDGTLARRERLQFVDTIKWQNPRTHASLTWSVPREEVRIVPISYQ